MPRSRQCCSGWVRAICAERLNRLKRLQQLSAGINQTCSITSRTGSVLVRADSASSSARRSMRTRSFSVVTSIRLWALRPGHQNPALVPRCTCGDRESLLCSATSSRRRRVWRKFLRIAHAGERQGLAPADRGDHARDRARAGALKDRQAVPRARSITGAAPAARTDDHQAPARGQAARPRGARSGPAGTMWPSPMPRRPSRTTMVRSLVSEAFCNPSSITTTPAPANCANFAPATRLREP